MYFFWKERWSEERIYHDSQAMAYGLANQSEIQQGQHWRIGDQQLREQV